MKVIIDDWYKDSVIKSCDSLRRIIGEVSERLISSKSKKNILWRIEYNIEKHLAEENYSELAAYLLLRRANSTAFHFEKGFDRKKPEQFGMVVANALRECEKLKGHVRNTIKRLNKQKSLYGDKGVGEQLDYEIEEAIDSLPGLDVEINLISLLMLRRPGNLNYLYGQKVTIPEFEIFSSPRINISDVKQRRFDIIDMVTQKARQEIMAQEDADVFKAIDDAVIVKSINTKEGKTKLAQAMSEPIRRNLDYQGFARRMFDIEQLPDTGNLTLDKEYSPDIIVLDEAA